MAKTLDDFNKRRLRSSNITVTISIALVLFLVGLIGLILINAEGYSNYLKEQLVVNAFFDENYDADNAAKTDKLEKEAFEKIKKLSFVKKARYISRDQAFIEAKKGMGIEIEDEVIIEKKVFPSSVEVTLFSDYVAPDKIPGVIKQLQVIPGVKDVKNASDFAADIVNNLNRILQWILGFSVLFLITAIVLINNSIRLKIFSKRFIIKTMQLVGAKRRFILKPFIFEAIILGIIGAVIGILALFGVWYYFTETIKTPFIQNTGQFVLLILGIFFLGIFITVASTIWATWRFLKTSVDDLYYT
ncbi:MAG: permease-like cell division protein FtsX [Flavobacteriaceae bacterium]|jgi:cell division transport system permease protein|nr:permease-like cell division protein FtsX [Flavobacteriaceae bacterium]